MNKWAKYKLWLLRSALPIVSSRFRDMDSNIIADKKAAYWGEVRFTLHVHCIYSIHSLSGASRTEVRNDGKYND